MRFYIPAWDALPLGKWIVPLAVLLIAVLYPIYQPNLFDVAVFGNFPSVDTGVMMMIFIMMALGLNIVVGYAGLLDLGYVAFYAMGAYTARGSRRSTSRTSTCTSAAWAWRRASPGIHISIWLVLSSPGSSRRSRAS